MVLLGFVRGGRTGLSIDPQRCWREEVWRKRVWAVVSRRCGLAKKTGDEVLLLLLLLPTPVCVTRAHPLSVRLPLDSKGCSQFQNSKSLCSGIYSLRPSAVSLCTDFCTTAGLTTPYLDISHPAMFTRWGFPQRRRSK